MALTNNDGKKICKTCKERKHYNCFRKGTSGYRKNICTVCEDEKRDKEFFVSKRTVGWNGLNEIFC